MSSDAKSAIIIAILFLAFIPINMIYAYFTRRKVTFVVREKGTLTHGYVNDGNGRTYTNFMVYTRDGCAFKNVNCLWFWKWRSTELQASLKAGKKYTAEIYGWRIGAFNIYPNIIKAKEVKVSNKKRRK